MLQIKLRNKRILKLTAANIAALKAMPATIYVDQQLTIGKYAISHDGNGNYIINMYKKTMRMVVPMAEFKLDKNSSK